MLSSTAFVLLDGWLQSKDWLVHSLIILVFGVIALGGIAAKVWPRLVRRAQERRARNWAPASAVIDLVTVHKEWQPGGRGAPGSYSYEVMLTYSWHDPGLQTGEFTRSFNSENDAQDWADACKGRTVTVHVDPKDPANSVLRTEELDAAVPKPAWW
ncbi:MAG TPA: DUF3592 domain-containing protein [Acidobacteriaceae bacterium]|jgi:hypothetical protein|nr:DUF3592 domain-containing protein [Acidobacteriaceae bacterium]